MPIQQVPYIVVLQEHGKPTCSGSILASNIILTSAHCVEGYFATYSILSGSACVDHGIHHNVITKIMHPGFRPRTYTDDLALLIIFPPIDLESFHNRKIEINERPVLTNTFATVSGWGCIDMSP